MIPVVIDASAGVELVVDTTRGQVLRSLLPADALPWVPDLFYVEVGTVLRRWDLGGVLSSAQVSEAIHQLDTWRVMQKPPAGIPRPASAQVRGPLTILIASSA